MHVNDGRLRLSPRPKAPRFILMTAPKQATATSDDVQNIVKDIDYLITPLSVEQLRTLSFMVDDIPMTVRPSKTDGLCKIQIEATLGYLPFTIESSQRRDTILHILHEAGSLFNVRFGVTRDSKIMAVGAYETDIAQAPDFIFYPLMKFLEEARPFMALIGKYLS